ncbi:MAG: hypothetical protein M3270_07295 [Thermoproteota archaeon]|nr:hypothetical protein [Thermoproteota archaeon]
MTQEEVAIVTGSSTGGECCYNSWQKYRRNVEPYAQHLIYGIDIAISIFIAISAAMAVIVFLRVITATRHIE